MSPRPGPPLRARRPCARTSVPYKVEGALVLLQPYNAVSVAAGPPLARRGPRAMVGPWSRAATPPGAGLRPPGGRVHKRADARRRLADVLGIRQETATKQMRACGRALRVAEDGRSTDDASRLTALLVGQIFPIFSLLAPCQPFSPGRAVLCLAFRDRLEPSPVSVLARLLPRAASARCQGFARRSIPVSLRMVLAISSIEQCVVSIDGMPSRLNRRSALRSSKLTCCADA